MCESIASLENDIPATMMARLLKYVVLKRRLQDLVDVEDMIQVSSSYIYPKYCDLIDNIEKLENLISSVKKLYKLG